MSDTLPIKYRDNFSPRCKEFRGIPGYDFGDLSKKGKKSSTKGAYTSPKLAKIVKLAISVGKRVELDTDISKLHTRPTHSSHSNGYKGSKLANVFGNYDYEKSHSRGKIIELPEKSVNLSSLSGTHPHAPKHSNSKHTTDAHGKGYVRSQNTAKYEADLEREVTRMHARASKKVDDVFSETVRDIRKLVANSLDPIANRKIRESKLIALGGKVAKNRKMPYSELQQRNKALERHLEKQRSLEKELGVKLVVDTFGGARNAEIKKRRKKPKGALFSSSTLHRIDGM